MADHEIIEKVRQCFASLRLGEPLHHSNLTLFPILGTNGHEPVCQLLQEGIKAGTAVVSEVSESGSVPTLKVENRGTKPLLIPEGEILVGAKQNRVVNMTVIVAVGMTFTLPVSCVERGRWRSVSHHFRSAYYAPPRLRADKVRSVQQQGAAGAVSDQGQVWNNVAGLLSDMKVQSGTYSLTDAYDKSEDVLQEYRKNVVLPENAIGVLVASGKEIIGLDLFESPKVLQALWPRISDSYFLEAARDRKQRKATATEVAQGFLTRVPRHLRPNCRTSSVGMEFDIEGPGLVGTAVWFQETLCHVSAFATAEEQRRDKDENVVQ